MSFTLIAALQNFTSLSPSADILDNCMGVGIMGRSLGRRWGSVWFLMYGRGVALYLQNTVSQKFWEPNVSLQEKLGITVYTATLVGI